MEQQQALTALGMWLLTHQEDRGIAHPPAQAGHEADRLASMGRGRKEQDAPRARRVRRFSLTRTRRRTDVLAA